MKTLLMIITLVLMLLPLRVLAAPSQQPGRGTCGGQIYSPNEVTRRAKIVQPNFNIISKVVGAHAVVDAVLCRSGRVTNIKVIEISPEEIRDLVIGAISEMRFKPAEMNWHTVSQRLRFEFHINEGGLKELDTVSAADRVIEDLDIMGNRRFTKTEVLSWIRIRPGDSFSVEKVKQDFNSVLSTGYFDKLYTRVFTEEANRGGVRVVFEVRELPLIFEVKFVGVNESEQASIDEGLRERKMNLRSGAPFDAVQAKMGSNVIEHFLESKRRHDVTVELLVENLAADKVSLTFIVTDQ